MANMVAFVTQSQHVASKPRANSPDSQLSCLEQRPPCCFCSVSLCPEKQGGQGAEMTIFFICFHMSGRSSGISSSWQARCFSPAAKAPIQAPRPAEDLKSQQKTMPKTPELSYRTPRQGAGWAHRSHGWSRSEVTRLGREVGRELSTPCANPCSTSGKQGL